MKDHLVSIQVLRAFAALAVVAFHLSVSWREDFGLTSQPQPALLAGAYGVDVFFVISGFIMSYTTAQAHQRSPGRFMFKRLARIVPLYWTMTLAIFVFATLAPHAFHAVTSSTAELLKSLFFFPYERTDGEVKPILFVGWTLNYEMFFYAVFAVSLLISRRFYLVITIAAIAGLSALGPFVHGGILASFYTNGLMLEFVWGCLLFLAFDRWPKTLAALSPIWIVGVVLVLAQNNFEPGRLRPFEVGLPAVMIVGGIVGGSMRDGPLRRTFARIGDASYSLYLGHPYVIKIATGRRRGAAAQHTRGIGELCAARAPLQPLATPQIFQRKSTRASRARSAGLIGASACREILPAILDDVCRGD
ncbi:MAG: acyltransferase [Alphaproteobacteria bacterium]